MSAWHWYRTIFEIFLNELTIDMLRKLLTICPLLIKFTIANHGYYTRGAFHLTTKLQFEIPNISCSEWDSIFRLVSVSRPSWTIHLHEFRSAPKQNKAEMVDSGPFLIALAWSTTANLKQTSAFLARQEPARAVEVDISKILFWKSSVPFADSSSGIVC